MALISGVMGRSGLLAAAARSCRDRRLASSLVTTRDHDLTRYITMTSPKTRNALSLEMLNTLQAELDGLPDQTRCVVLAGEGPAFSAGHNLKELTSADGRSHHQLVFDTCTKLMLSIQNLTVPVIAQIDGVAAAAGLQLAATCDIVLATPRSTFSTPGGSVGIFCSTPGIPLVRCVPRQVAALMLLTGQPISAEQALRAGLVSQLVEPDQLTEVTGQLSAAIISKSRAVIGLGKRFLYRQMELSVEEAYRLGSQVMVDNLALCDAQEGIASFVQKRRPVWRHTDEKAHL